MSDIEQRQISQEVNIENELISNNSRLAEIDERISQINSEFRDSFDMLNERNKTNKK